MDENGERHEVTILLAEDDPGDQMLIRKAFTDESADCRINIVEDGDELVDYLSHAGAYSDKDVSPRPRLILLDLNLPKKDGREALGEIKADSDLRRIPVVILTTSDQQADIIQCYDLGANSFITKPSSFDGLTAMAREIQSYWFDLSQTPSI